jgi:hypothetical protein
MFRPVKNRRHKRAYGRRRGQQATGLSLWTPRYRELACVGEVDRTNRSPPVPCPPASRARRPLGSRTLVRRRGRWGGYEQASATPTLQALGFQGRNNAPVGSLRARWRRRTAACPRSPAGSPKRPPGIRIDGRPAHVTGGLASTVFWRGAGTIGLELLDTEYRGGIVGYTPPPEIDCVCHGSNNAFRQIVPSGPKPR